MANENRKDAIRHTWVTRDGGATKSTKLPHGKKKGWNDKPAKDKGAEI